MKKITLLFGICLLMGTMAFSQSKKVVIKTAKITENVVFNDEKPAISVLFKTPSTKEIRILMKKGQQMKEHQTPYPITVEIFEGKVTFGVNGKKYETEKGDILSLEGGVPHDLVATENSIIRLTLSNLDKLKRVKKVLKK